MQYLAYIFIYERERRVRSSGREIGQVNGGGIHIYKSESARGHFFKRCSLFLSLKIMTRKIEGDQRERANRSIPMLGGRNSGGEPDIK